MWKRIVTISAVLASGFAGAGTAIADATGTILKTVPAKTVPAKNCAVKTVPAKTRATSARMVSLLSS